MGGNTTRRSAGLTLPELLVTVSLVALLATQALPTFAQWQAHRRLRDAAENYRSQLQWARQQAMARHQSVYLQLGASAEGSCYRFVMGQRPTCGCADATCPAPETTLARVVLPTQQGVALGTTGQQTTVHIDPELGTLQPTVTAVFSLADGTALHQVTNLVGRTRTCSPSGAWRGFEAC